MKTLLEPAAVGVAEVDAATLAAVSPTSGPVFLVGMWRSGTSLFYALLNQHPQIALMYEGDLFLLRSMFWLPGRKSTWVERWQFWNQAPTRHKIDIEEPERESSLRANIERAYRETALRKGARIFGEKSPNYYDSLTRLAQTFPHARFIVIWRDPASICRSIIQAAEDPSSWFRRKGMIIRTLLGYKVLKSQCDQLSGKAVPLLQIQYERLVKDPVKVMRSVCRFLEIPFDPRMVSLQAADRSAIYQGEHHSLVKSESIVSSHAHDEVLPLAIKNKIQRYVAGWRAETDGAWPAMPPAERLGAAKPTFWERIVDPCAYHGYRTLDSLVGLIYSLAPLSVLQAWRQRPREARIENGKIEEKN